MTRKSIRPIGPNSNQYPPRKMAIFLVQLFFLLLLPQGRVLADVECMPTKCSSNGTAIHFPFWLKGHQPDHCGYPCFALSCSPTNRTQLHHSTFGDLLVADIDYINQRIRFDYPGPSGCLQLLNSSTDSPFQLMTYGDKTTYSFFRCPKNERYGMSKQFHCLGDPSHSVYVYANEYFLDEYDIQSCRKLLINFAGDAMVTEEGIWFGWSKPTCGNCHGISCQNTTTHRAYGRIGLSLVVVVVVLALFLLYRSRKTKKEDQKMIERFLKDYKALKPTRYTYTEIKKITNNFIEKLGQGGYGTVYKGKLSSDVHVAAKILKNTNGNGDDEFINEVGTIGTIHHVNVVRLVGYCADGFRRALVYEYLPNDSLEKFISSPGHRQQRPLTWEKLQEIALGIAKGIEYLHQGCDQRILHFDIKPHNILLDHNFNPKVSDFGLAKLCSKDQSAVSMTIARGTIGYIAPEVFSRNFGNVSYKSDVYSFGMLLLEMAGGRENPEIREDVDSCEVYFPEWIYNHLNSTGEDVGIEIEEDQGDSKIVKKLMTVGLWCIQWSPGDRPSMQVVVQMLEGDRDNLSMPPNQFLTRNSAARRGSRGDRTMNFSLDIISETESENS